MNPASSAAEIVIEMKDLAVGYGKKRVLSNIHAKIAKGQFVSLLGPNGAGKTTLLRTITRHLRKLDGVLLLNNKPIETYRYKELAANLAVVLTSRISTELFTGFEFAAMGRHPHTGLMGNLTLRDKNIVWESLRLVNAENLAARPMNELSDGEKQKLFIARALCQEPKIIVLDEPTAHLDLKHKMEIMAILAEFCRTKGITIVASLHDVGIAARISDQVALIKNGSVVAWGSPEEVLHDANLSDLYEITLATYDRRIGTLELKCSPGTGKVFCISGAGTGAVLYRSLARNKLNVTTGILHENDIDCHIATALGFTTITAPPFTKIPEGLLEKCLSPIEDADYILDTGFPIQEANKMNVRLLEHALEAGKPVISMRKERHFFDLPLEGKNGITFVENEQSVLDILTGAFGHVQASEAPASPQAPTRI